MKKLIAILMALALTLGMGALAEGTLTAQGAGVVMVDADCASVNLGVREIAPDVMTVQGMVNAKIDAVLKALNEMGVEDGAISTGSIGIYPNYGYDDDGEEFVTGYTAYDTLAIELKDVDSVGAVIDAAFAAGANSLDYVEYTAANTAEAAEQALALAIQNATDKAAAMAGAAGVKLGGVIEVREADSPSYDFNYGAAAKDEGLGAGTQVRAARQQVRASVTLTFEIESADE